MELKEHRAELVLTAEEASVYTSIYTDWRNQMERGENDELSWGDAVTGV